MSKKKSNNKSKFVIPKDLQAAIEEVRDEKLKYDKRENELMYFIIKSAGKVELERQAMKQWAKEINQLKEEKGALRERMAMYVYLAEKDGKVKQS